MSFIVDFNIIFETKFGENILVAGSIPELGIWKYQDAFPLIWTDGNIWQNKAPISVNQFEYKYLKKGPDGILWEIGHNRIANLSKKIGKLSDTWNHQKVKIILTDAVEKTVYLTSNCYELTKGTQVAMVPKEKQAQKFLQFKALIPLEIRKIVYQFSSCPENFEIDFEYVKYRKNCVKMFHSLKNEQKEVKRSNNVEKHLKTQKYNCSRKKSDQICETRYIDKYIYYGNIPQNQNDVEQIKKNFNVDIFLYIFIDQQELITDFEFIHYWQKIDNQNFDLVYEKMKGLINGQKKTKKGKLTQQKTLYICSEKQCQPLVIIMLENFLIKQGKQEDDAEIIVEGELIC